MKRALYYASRELAAQLGTLTGKTDYGALEKVYSIWICNRNIPTAMRDTVTGYSIRKQDIIGKTEELECEDDLLSVIIIRRGGSSKEKIFDYLDSIFKGDLTRIEAYTGTEGNERLREEVTRMTGLGTGILEEGIEQGIELGKKEASRETAFQLFQNGVDFGVVERSMGELTTEELSEIYEQAAQEKTRDRSGVKHPRR